jgi:hypothetical protein
MVNVFKISGQAHIYYRYHPNGVCGSITGTARAADYAINELKKGNLK